MTVCGPDISLTCSTFRVPYRLFETSRTTLPSDIFVRGVRLLFLMVFINPFSRTSRRMIFILAFWWAVTLEHLVGAQIRVWHFFGKYYSEDIIGRLLYRDSQCIRMTSVFWLGSKLSSKVIMIDLEGFRSRESIAIMYNEHYLTIWTRFWTRC